MHLTAFTCIFLPLYTHLGQAYTIFAPRIFFIIHPIHIQLAHPLVCKKMKKMHFFVIF